MRRYLLHPLFLLAIALNIVVCGVLGISEEERSSSTGFAIVPAATFGVLGIVIMASLTRRSEKLRIAAGVVPVTERARSLALIAACAVPFAAGLVWWAWAVWAFNDSPPPPDGFPFGPVAGDDVWVAAVLFGEGPMASLGGPLLGILVARWFGTRAAPILTAVGVIAFSHRDAGPLRSGHADPRHQPLDVLRRPVGREGRSRAHAPLHRLAVLVGRRTSCASASSA